MENQTRKFNSNFRKNIKHKISKISNKNDYIDIYKIINEELDSKLSINKNGIYFNLNLLSDNCVEKLLLFFNNKIETENINSEKIKYEPYNKNYFSELQFITGNKLNNQEKSLIKKFNNDSI